MTFSPSCRALTIGGVPVLLASLHAHRSPHATYPLVLWFHGFRADALAHAAELERCAALGFLAVGVDAVGHGARVHHDLQDCIARSPGGALPVVLDLADATRKELPVLTHELVESHGADPARVSAVGISMGAFLVYRAIALGSPFRAAVALLGSPEWSGPACADLPLDPFRLVRLLSITAEHDASVPPAEVGRLHSALQEQYGSQVTHRHHVLQGAGHFTSAHEWQDAMTRTLEWLQKHG